MKAYKSPCVAILGSVADATAAEYPGGVGVCCVTDRHTRIVQLMIRLPDHGTAAVAYMANLDAIDEVISELQAARADMVKLLGAHPASPSAR
jgi:hypothetical protein